MKQGGFAVFAGLTDGGVGDALLAESLAMSPAATESRLVRSDGTEGRGGKPERCFLNGPGGPEQQRFYQAPGLLSFLRDLTHRSIARTGVLGTYSYYARPGDFLGLHRDIVTCDVAVITCLRDTPASARGGQLRLYPDRIHEPLSAIRATPASGAMHVRLAAGQTIVFYGGLLPHMLLPVDAGQVRIVSVLCFRVS